MEALWIWRQFPKQIARDLHRFHHLKIADWLRGTRDADGQLKLSSYELLNYLEYLDEDGAFQTDAIRGGRWTTTKQMLAETVNEAYRYRALYLRVKFEEPAWFDPTEFEFVDPVTHQERKEAEEAEAEEAEQAADEFWDQAAEEEEG